MAASLRAIELDPLSPAVAGSAGWRFVFARQFERGAEFGQRIVERWPEGGTGYLPLSECLTKLGRHQEAVAAAEKGVSLMNRSPMALCRLRFTLAKAGALDRAREVLTEMLHPAVPWVVQFGYTAMVQFALGDKSAGLTSLQRAFDERELVLPWVLSWPLHDELRGEPGFAELWRKVGLPE